MKLKQKHTPKQNKKSIYNEIFNKIYEYESINNTENEKKLLINNNFRNNQNYITNKKEEKKIIEDVIIELFPIKEVFGISIFLVYFLIGNFILATFLEKSNTLSTIIGIILTIFVFLIIINFYQNIFYYFFIKNFSIYNKTVISRKEILNLLKDAYHYKKNINLKKIVVGYFIITENNKFK